jgi:hypothetical protein
MKASPCIRPVHSHEATRLQVMMINWKSGPDDFDPQTAPTATS